MFADGVVWLNRCSDFSRDAARKRWELFVDSERHVRHAGCGTEVLPLDLGKTVVGPWSSALTTCITAEMGAVLHFNHLPVYCASRMVPLVYETVVEED